MVSIVETAINISASIFFLKKFGIIGIAYGTVVAFTIERIILLFISWRKYKISIFDLINVKRYAIYSLLLIVTFVAVKILNFS